jgi:hypothetical protein
VRALVASDCRAPAPQAGVGVEGAVQAPQAGASEARGVRAPQAEVRVACAVDLEADSPEHAVLGWGRAKGEE